MPERRDFLAVCNDQGVPLTAFQATFCVRCVQPECSRSRAGGLFETRVTTWQDRLFENPPRMSKDDAIYGLLTAKRFIEVDTGKIPELRGPSEWIDPRALAEVSEPAAKPRAAKAPRSPEASVESSPGHVARPVALGGPLNTPFVQGTMLEGAPPSPPKPDRWAAAPNPAVPEAPDAPIVKAGAKIKFTVG